MGFKYFLVMSISCLSDVNALSAVREDPWLRKWELAMKVCTVAPVDGAGRV